MLSPVDEAVVVVAAAVDAHRLHQTRCVPVDAKVHALPSVDCNNSHKLHDKGWGDRPRLGAEIANVRARVH